MNFKKSACGLFVILMLQFSVQSATAHTALVSATPAENSVLTAVPSEVKLQFDDKLLTIGGSKTNYIEVTDSQGARVDAANPTVTGSSVSVDIKATELSGLVTVNWRVVAYDGHPEEGSYRFSVQDVTQTPTPIDVTTTMAPEKSSNSGALKGLYVALIAGVAIGIVIYSRKKMKQ